MIKWFEADPGSSISKSTSDDDVFLVGRPVPTCVRLPAEIGGSVMTVERSSMAKCPMCESDDREKRHLHLKDSNLSVAECKEHGFVWYAQKI